MLEYLKKLFSKGYIYLGLLFFIDGLISFISNIEIALPQILKYIFLVFVFFYATYSVWKDEREEKLNLIIDKNTNNISKEAKELLNEATKDKDGDILKTESHEGTSIKTNNKHFIEENNVRSSAKYISALEELVEIKFLTTTNEVIYTVTNDGYEYIDDITK